MKGILTQWIGGSKANSKTLAASGTGEASVSSDTPSEEQQSFVGLMMGFLGMKSPQDTSGDEGISTQGQQQEGSSGVGGPTDKQYTGKPPATSLDNLQSSAIRKKLESTTPAAASDTKNNSSLPSTNQPVISQAKAKAEHSATAEGMNSSLVDSTEKSSQVQEKGKDRPVPLSTATSSASAKADSMPIAHDALKAGSNKQLNAGFAGIEKPVKATGSQGMKQQYVFTASAQNQQTADSELQEKLSKLTTGGKTQQATAEKPTIEQKNLASNRITKDLKAQQKTESLLQKQEFPKQAGIIKNVETETTQQARTDRDVSRLTQGLINRNSTQPAATLLSSNKPQADMSAFSPAAFSDESLNMKDPALDIDMKNDTPDQTEGASKEFQMNDFKTAQLKEAGVRKSFSRQLAQVTRTQRSQSPATSTQKGAWSHHRFVLNDGSSINISARSSEGALQLQLNAGNGELGKTIQQHLPEIQQHIQQELDIDIDLQFQDFGGSQPDAQADESSAGSEPQLSNPQNLKENTSARPSESPRKQVRYMGFNQNEWTA